MGVRTTRQTAFLETATRKEESAFDKLGPDEGSKRRK